MAANSFIVKGWAVTFVAAILAFTGKDGNRFGALVALLPAVLFWRLDSFFLHQERLFRNLYDAVRANPMREPDQVDFSLKTTELPAVNSRQKLWNEDRWFRCALSKTIWPFYFILIVVIGTVYRIGPAGPEEKSMARRAFFSFHYERDIWRSSIVRNSWVTQDRTSAGFFDASLWEDAKKKGDAAVKKMIDDALQGTSVTVVLIGAETSTRPYVKYEIDRSVAMGNGIVGVYIHNINNASGQTDVRGSNPLPSKYRTYDYVNDSGYANLGAWIEEAAKNAGR